MLALSFFSWWYGRGWKQVITSFGPRLQGVADAFSMRQLVRTLFAPWRRIITPPGAGIPAKLRAMLDNVVSRAVGFVVRLLVLIGAIIAIIVVVTFTIAEAVLWPLLPPAVPILLIAGAVA